MKKMLYTLLALQFLLQTVSADQSESLSLVVKVTGAHPANGQILASLFDGQNTHMKIPVLEQIAAVNGTGTAEIEFLVGIAGSYSVVVVHDLDSDGQLDTGLFGIPKEKIGFSNNAKGRMGPAPWSKARFTLNENPTHLEISLNNAK